MSPPKTTKKGQTAKTTKSEKSSSTSEPASTPVSAPAQPAQVKPATDSPPSGANTVGKVVPQTAPAPKGWMSRAADAYMARRERILAEQRAKSPQEKLGDMVDILSTIRGGALAVRPKPGVKANTPGPEPSTPGSTTKPATPQTQSTAPSTTTPKSAQGGGGGYSVGSGGKEDCGIKPYKDQKCPKGQQAHHIVPDYSLRYGNRADKTKRIEGMPSLEDGPSICLSGGSKTQGSDHNKAHEGTDPRIVKEGQRTDNGPIGTAPIGDIINISVEEVSKVKPHCADEIKKKTDEAFKNVDPKKLGRTTQQPPKEGTAAHGELKPKSTEPRNMPRRGRRG